MINTGPKEPANQTSENEIRNKALLTALATIAVIHIQRATHRRYSLTMNKTSVDVGVAGSITMIVLTVTVVILLRSFYKRFTNVRKDDK